MTEIEPKDDTWEEFFGSSTDLMPCIMGALDAIIENTNYKTTTDIKNSGGKRNFNNLSPYVQKVLSNVNDDELNIAAQQQNVIETTKKITYTRNNYRSLKSPEKSLNQSNESLDIISPNVQKMISNFPENELIFTCNRNNSFLHNQTTIKFDNSNNKNNNELNKNFSLSNNSDCDNSDSEKSTTGTYLSNSKPLGSYLHKTSSGIASRTPVGRKNLGKYSQVPSESSVGTVSSTVSSEVSRPVSLTSLGSCSSSGSSGPHQPNSAYLASAESLDSDPEPISSQVCEMMSYCLGSADSGISVQTPIINPEARVLQEVLDTETVYVSDLNEVIQGYLEPWRNEPCEGPIKPFLSALFSNIEEIYNFNKDFLEQLQQADNDPIKVANAFIENDSGFIVYNEYCQNYPRTMNVLSELTRNDKMAMLFREKQLALGHALPLGSYLLKPVQRILKYHLLLQRLSKQCSDNHKGVIDLALNAMTSVALSINNMKRKHEHAVRVQEIQSQLYGWNGPDLTALGELIAEGIFRVSNAKGRRYIFLFDKVLLMAKSKQDGALAYKSHIMCSNLMLVEQVRGEPLSFQVLPFDNPRLQCTLRARSAQHKREWTLQIKRVILENYSAVIPNHARQLVMQLGQDVQDTESTTSDKWLPIKQNSTPHYLERRSRVRKSHNFSNGRRAASQDRSFPSIGSWRRKSEPTFISQYNTITTKSKKIKGSSTFYTDLSDSENNEIITESNESLETKDNLGVKSNENIEKIVSDLIMQNEDFLKVMNKQRKPKNINENEHWFDDNTNKLTNKADSLPRSFQLNEIEGNSKELPQNQDNVSKLNSEINGKEQSESSDISFQLDEQNDYPEHKIYRKSAIRLSILQRFRAILSEEQKGVEKYSLIHKQGSKSIGEKIANQDYVDPQKLFTNSCNSSRTNLSWELNELEPEKLDMTINENEVLNEIDKRLNDNDNNFGTKLFDIKEQNSSSQNGTNNKFIKSSQNSDSLYECELEKNLVEEYIKDDNGKLVAKQDSFKTINKNEYLLKKTKIKRPTKAPPPIPIKPKRLTTGPAIKNRQNIISNKINDVDNNVTPKSWVKSMVGRFE